MLSLLLTGCTPVVRTAGDEIRLVSGAGEYDNGNTASLTFGEGTAAFTLHNSDFDLCIDGLCSMSDDSFVILNGEDGVGYTFAYRLHGDSVELFYRGGTLTLDKIKEPER